jgi:hypothetical protein
MHGITAIAETWTWVAQLYRKIKIKFTMKRLSALLILMYACHDPLAGIKSTEYYQIARENLRKEGIERTALLSREEVESHKFIVFGKDTVYLKQSKLLFGILDKKTEYIFIFQFYTNKGYRRFTCTSQWKVITEYVQVGEGCLIPKPDSS